MLIEKRHAPEVNDTVTIKLISGEEIVGRLSECGNDTVTLTKPVQILMHQIAPNKMGLAFQPVLGSISEQITMQFNRAAISIGPVKTGEDVTRNYIQATTGLIAADHIAAP
jgi:hypothetical protein